MRTRERRILLPRLCHTRGAPARGHDARVDVHLLRHHRVPGRGDPPVHGRLHGMKRLRLPWSALVLGMGLVLCASHARAQGAAAGYSHTSVVAADGTAWAWGLNDNGQVGDGTTTQRVLPTSLSTLTTVSAIADGSSHSLAVKSNGTVWAWGYNSNG